MTETKTLNQFYFNTGVLYANYPYLYGDQVNRGGTKQIPFQADAPQDAHLMFLCDNPNLPESTIPGVIVREVFNTSMCSKYAYFRLPGIHKDTADDDE